MAAELVNSATSDKLAEMDWMKNIEICEMVAHDQKYIYQLLSTFGAAVILYLSWP